MMNHHSHTPTNNNNHPLHINKKHGNGHTKANIMYIKWYMMVVVVLMVFLCVSDICMAQGIVQSPDLADPIKSNTDQENIEGEPSSSTTTTVSTTTDNNKVDASITDIATPSTDTTIDSVDVDYYDKEMNEMDEFTMRLKGNGDDYESLQKHLETLLLKLQLILTRPSPPALPLYMKKKEDELKGEAHYRMAKLSMGGVILPVMEPKAAPSSFFHLKHGVESSSLKHWKKDWMIELSKAIEEDWSMGESFFNEEHYLPVGFLPMNLQASLFHLHESSILGHSSSRSLLSLLIDQSTRGHSPSTHIDHSTSSNKKSDENVEKNKQHESTSTTPSTTSTTTSTTTKQQDGGLFESSTTKKTSLVSDWQGLSHLWGVLSDGPSSSLSSSYRMLYGVDTHPTSCNEARNKLNAASKELLTLYKRQIPGPPSEFEGHGGEGGSSGGGGNAGGSGYGGSPVRLSERFTSQSLGSHLHTAEYEKPDLLQYYRYSAHTGEIGAVKAVGLLMMYGGHGMHRDYQQALKYLQSSHQRSPSSSLAYLTYLGLGLPEGPQPQQAFSIFEASARLNDTYAMFALGLIHTYGLPPLTRPDPSKGVPFLLKAAQHEHPDALFHLGILFQEGYPNSISNSHLREEGGGKEVYHLQADPGKGITYLIRAAQHQHLPALLQLASTTGRCEDATQFFRRVMYTSLLRPIAMRAFEFYEYGLYDHSALLYQFMASMGHETGQLNAAWMKEMALLDPHVSLKLKEVGQVLLPYYTQSKDSPLLLSHVNSLLSSSFQSIFLYLRENTLGGNELRNGIKEGEGPLELDPTAQYYTEFDAQEALYESESHHHHHHPSSTDQHRLHHQHSLMEDDQRAAFDWYRLAAQQGSAEAHLKVGDFYYYGRSIPTNFNLSAQYYTAASNLKHVQATFNMGWMYQRGLGVPRDFHLAKRFYDRAASLSSDAFVPTSLALSSLSLQEFLFGSLDHVHLAWDNSVLLFLTIFVLCLALWKFRIARLGQ